MHRPHADAVARGKKAEKLCDTGTDGGRTLSSLEQIDACQLAGITPFRNNLAMLTAAEYTGNKPAELQRRLPYVKRACDLELAEFVGSPPFEMDPCVYWVETYRPPEDVAIATLLPICNGVLLLEPGRAGRSISSEPERAWAGYQLHGVTNYTPPTFPPRFAPERACRMLNSYPSLPAQQLISTFVAGCQRGLSTHCHDLAHRVQIVPPDIVSWAQNRGFDLAAHACRTTGYNEECARVAQIAPARPEIAEIQAAGQRVVQQEIADRTAERREQEAFLRELDAQRGARDEQQQQIWLQGQQALQAHFAQQAAYQQQMFETLREAQASQSAGDRPSPAPSPTPAAPPPPAAEPTPGAAATSAPQRSGPVDTVLTVQAVGNWTSVSEESAHRLGQAECGIEVRRKCNTMTGQWIGDVHHNQAFCSTQVVSGTQQWRCGESCTMTCRHTP